MLEDPPWLGPMWRKFSKLFLVKGLKSISQTKIKQNIKLLKKTDDCFFGGNREGDVMLKL